MRSITSVMELKRRRENLNGLLAKKVMFKLLMFRIILQLGFPCRENATHSGLHILSKNDISVWKDLQMDREEGFFGAAIKRVVQIPTWTIWYAIVLERYRWIDSLFPGYIFLLDARYRQFTTNGALAEYPKFCHIIYPVLDLKL